MGPQEGFPVALGVDPHRARCRNEGIVSGEFSLGSCLSPEPGPPVFQLLLTQHFRPMADPMDCAHRRACPLQPGGRGLPACLSYPFSLYSSFSNVCPNRNRGTCFDRGFPVSFSVH